MALGDELGVGFEVGGGKRAAQAVELLFLGGAQQVRMAPVRARVEGVIAQAEALRERDAPDARVSR